MTAWRRDVDGPDQAKRDEALSQIRAITDVEVIGPFEGLLAETNPAATSTFSREMIGVLGRMQDAQAHVCPGRSSALQPRWPDARDAAIVQLKRHELTDYVPYTLGNMLTLYESKYVMTVDPNGTVHYQQHTKRQRPDADDVGLNQTSVVPAIGMVARWRSRQAR